MTYNANSIKVKNFVTACRDNVGMYLGEDGKNGIFNGFMEILNNSVDEAIMGRGSSIVVTLSEDEREITILDYGAGIPHGPNDDCEEVLVELFTTAHSSGKFNSANYRKVRGIHGVGAGATCATSSHFIVTSYRDGYEWELEFVDGNPQTKVAICRAATNQTGTKITYTPNPLTFHLANDDKLFDGERIRKEMELSSYFLPKIHFVFCWGDKKWDYYSENGIKDFAKTEIINPLHSNIIYGYKCFEDDVEVEFLGQWTKNPKEKVIVLSNGAINVDGGTPVQGWKSGMTRTVNSLSKINFEGDIIRKGFSCIISVKHPSPIYQNQTKTKIQNAELSGYTQKVVGEALRNWAHKHREEFETIVNLMSKEAKAEKAAEKARQQVLQATNDIEAKQKRKTFNSDKLKDAEFLGEDSVLLIVEGETK